MKHSDFALTILLAAGILLSACGGGGSGNTASAANEVPAATAPQSFSIGGTISGLGSDGGLALRNGDDVIHISPQATSFTFPHLVAQGDAYSVTLASPLASGRPCVILNGAGIVASTAVQSVVVQCDPTPTAPTPTSTPVQASVFNTLAAGLSNVVGIATDGAGNVYTASGGLISKTTPAGVTSNLTDANKVPVRSFLEVTHLTADQAGNVYVLDVATVFKISHSGNVSVLAQLPAPAQRIAVNNTGTLYLIVGNTIQKLSPSGDLTTLAGSTTAGSVDGTATAAGFDNPRSIAVDGAANVYVLESNKTVVRKISPQGQVTTLQFGDAFASTCDGFFGCVFSQPMEIATDFSGNLYLAARGFVHYTGGAHSTIFTSSKLLKYTADSRLSVIDVGTAASDYLGGLAVDSTGTIYLVDSTKNSVLVMRP